ncbi:hypothetical protein IMZ38_03250 [Thermosphaera chiliense]|uniref:Uncharacterized protein n=1 Tax=Thermosphaera chiliense TaxID=3402707 RepID=A0A7M1USB2_9CREN|nr:hypothetical protein [Thermosphaera aggregans]QOR94936.1 hypothetical protein IMZ38_03250 [Thermosphaera aggregans]
MAKNPSVLLASELVKHGFVLLDVYHTREGDLIRAVEKITGKVVLVKSKTPVSSITGLNDIAALVNEVSKQAKQ